MDGEGDDYSAWFNIRCRNLVSTFSNINNFVTINMGEYEEIITDTYCFQHNMDYNIINNYN